MGHAACQPHSSSYCRQARPIGSETRMHACMHACPPLPPAAHPPTARLPTHLHGVVHVQQVVVRDPDALQLLRRGEGEAQALPGGLGARVVCGRGRSRGRSSRLSTAGAAAASIGSDWLQKTSMCHDCKERGTQQAGPAGQPARQAACGVWLRQADCQLMHTGSMHSMHSVHPPVLHSRMRGMLRARQMSSIASSSARP